jgi:hypothetical protein
MTLIFYDLKDNSVIQFASNQNHNYHNYLCYLRSIQTGII